VTNKATLRDYRLLDVRPKDRAPLRVLIYHPRCDEYAQVLGEHLAADDVTPASLASETLATVDILLAWKCPASILSSLTRLRWVQVTSTGIDQILDHYRNHPDLIVTTTKGFQVETVSSLAFLMMLALHWRLPALLEQQQRQVWSPLAMRPTIGRSTCAIIGAGRLGRGIAAHAKQLGMTVIGMKRRAEPVPGIDRVYGEDGLHHVVAVGDFVVLALPLTEKTRNMFGHAEFQRMKRSAYLINVARGGIVNENALIDALARSTIAGAAIDVAEEEPLSPAHPLWTAPNLVVTPHIGADRADYVEGVATIFIENLCVFPDVTRMAGLASAADGY
jgi:phosphoglycerate dehydrogenase-like enzyme